ncbi:MAG: VWA domain-containing protein [Acidobacteriota bacterium]
MAQRPGGDYASRPLHIIWLLDCSGSMRQGGKMEALNNAIREVIPAMRSAAENNPEVQFYVRAVRFSTGASWHVMEPTALGDFKWVDLAADGETDMGQAFTLLAADLNTLPAASRMLPPQVILVSDGKPTDDWRGGLQALFDTPWGKRAIRQAIAIGQDADQETLRKFIDNPERPVIRADNAEQLVRYFRYVSTSVAATAPGKDLPPKPEESVGQLFDDSAW